MSRSSLRQFSRSFAAVSTLALAACCAGALGAPSLEFAWSHNAGGLGRAEIVAFDAAAQEFLVVNGTDRCVMRLDVQTGRELGRLDVSQLGDPTSVAAGRGLIAVAVVAPVKTDPGHIAIFRSAKLGVPQSDAGDAKPVAVVRVGALPDMVTFSPDGRYILAANEGELSDDYLADPEGSVSVIDVGRGAAAPAAVTADFVVFNSQRDELAQQGVRLTAPNPNAADGRATVAQDLEPEYVSVAPDGRTAWVTLQENNALAIVNLETALVERIVALGLKDHAQSGNGLDASDVDVGVHIRTWPVWGMYQPDAIAAFEAEGASFIVTANEGDGRGYTAFTDAAMVSELTLDPSLLVNDSELTKPQHLGNLKVSRVGGDTDGDGDVDRLLAFGARSIAIWNAAGELVYDSGDAIEQSIAEHLPDRFNSDQQQGSAVDSRSDDKGPEPEGLVVGRVGEATYAFVGLERPSAIAVFDVTRPAATKLVAMAPLALAADATGGPHIAPEGLCFVPAEHSPTGDPLLAVACEVTGTTILFRVRDSK